jgi:hypothetical protein
MYHCTLAGCCFYFPPTTILSYLFAHVVPR